MSYAKNLPPVENNLGYTAEQGSNSGRMGLVYTQEQSRGHPMQHHMQQDHPPQMNQTNYYQQTTYEFPKLRYDYAIPQYQYPVYERSSLYYPSPYRIHDDRISQFFIGSVTVMGLFILYRLLEKNK